MKAISLLFCLILISLTEPYAQQNKPTPPKTGYNAERAKKLGADELGNRNYIIAFVKEGPVKLTNSKEMVLIKNAHLQNMQKLILEGKLLVSGPFTDNKSMKGFYIFDVPSIEEARTLTFSDPAIKAGALILELHPWYGTAALKEIPGIHKQIQKKKFPDDN